MCTIVMICFDLSRPSVTPQHRLVRHVYVKYYNLSPDVTVSVSNSAIGERNEKKVRLGA
jgi:hypothetical protein